MSGWRDEINEIREAAALKYDERKDKAPEIVASGKGFWADSIVKIARESGVQIVKDPGLSAALLKLSVGDEIPEQLYKAVAQILVFVYSLK